MSKDIQPYEQKQDASLAPVEVASSRASQEVQGQIVMAKKFPRDLVTAQTRILEACRRKGLADAALYSYPKGGTQVTGPSIRLAEMMAQCWGNMDFGIVELEQRKGESSVMTYAWDLETNTRQTKVFTVPHTMKARGEIKTLTDPRDIYEHVANQGARRLRACILGIIPGDIQDSAIEACKKTLAGDGSVPLLDRVRKMIVAFAEFAITPEMIAERMAHNIEAIDETELLNLRGIFVSLRDGASSREQWFNVGDEAPASDNPDDLTAGKKTKPKKKPPAAKKEPELEVKGDAADKALALAMQLAKVKLDECGLAAINDHATKLVDAVALGLAFDLNETMTTEMWTQVTETIKGLAAQEIEDAVKDTTGG